MPATPSSLEVLDRATTNLLGEYQALVRSALLREHEDLAPGIRSGLTGISNSLGTDIREYLDNDYVVEVADVLAALGTPEERRNVLNALLEFLGRYYRDGEFDTTRRRGAHGARVEAASDDDVVFRWRNRGAHYVKSGVQAGTQIVAADSARSVVVRVADSDSPRDNNKAELMVHQFEGVEVDDERVVISMRWDRHDDVTRKNERAKAQAAEIEKTVTAVTEAADDLDADVVRKLLRRYVRESNTDFLVHPDLAAFLSRELSAFLVDTFLGSELASLPSQEALHRLVQVQAATAVAAPVIRRLGALESIKAQLFEKRRVVLDERWLVRADQLPDHLADAVLANDRQQEAWVELFGLNEPATRDTLSERPGLVVDTRWFDESFVTELLTALTEHHTLDDLVDGIVVGGENYGAMRTLLPTYAGRMKVAYLDVPYNTGSDGFLYKDAFGRHSTWLTMMEQRIRLVRDLLGPDGALLVSIDDNEESNSKQLLDLIFGETNYLTTLTWEGALLGDATFVSEGHDSIHAYLKNFGYLSDRIRRWKAEVKAAKESGEELPESPFAWKTAKGGTEAVIKKGKELAKKHAIAVELPIGEYLDRCWAASTELQAWYRDLDETNPSKVYAGTYKHVDHVGAYEAGNPSWPGGGGPDFRPAHPTVEGYRCPPPSRGWIYQHDRWDEEVAARRIHWPEDHTKSPRTKSYMAQQTKSVLRSVFYGNRAKAAAQLDAVIGGKGSFPHPKHPEIVRQLIEAAGDENAFILDVFAGSGTTAASTIEQNRREVTAANPDGGRRRFLLTEMGEYLDDITVRRIIRLMHSQHWKDGTPVPPKRNQTWQDLAAGGPKLVRVLQLESFDQTLATVLHGTLEGRTTGALHPDMRLDELPLDVPGAELRAAVRNDDGTASCAAVLPTALLALGITERRRQTITVDGVAYQVATGTDPHQQPAAVVLRPTPDDLDTDACRIDQVLATVGADPTWRLYVEGPCTHPRADDLATAVAASILSRDPHMSVR